MERAQHEADIFAAEHARELLEERQAEAREVAEKLTRAGREAARLHSAFVAVERVARGLSTENVGGHAGGVPIPPEVARMSMDELNDYLLGRQELRLAERGG